MRLCLIFGRQFERLPKVPQLALFCLIWQLCITTVLMSLILLISNYLMYLVKLFTVAYK